jgi:hypothetical protein
VTLPSLPSGVSGLAWNTNGLATSGTLAVYSFTSTNLAIVTASNTAAIISSNKLATHVSSAQGTPVAVSASTPTNGTASVTAGALTYTPNSGFTGADGFTVTFNDGKGAQTLAVSVTVGNGTNQGANAVYTGTSGGQAAVHFAGIPGTSYTVETNAAASGSGWVKEGNYTAPPTDAGYGIGVFGVTNAFSGSLFYRTVYPSY